MSGSPDGSPTSTLPRSDGLRGRFEPVARLAAGERAAMYALLERYFGNTSRQRFEHDLDEKESALLLYDADGQLQGFSTLMRLSVQLAGRPAVAFFSGDTIIDRAHWGETTLPKLWSRHVFGLAAELRGTPAYWFLISSGYKTYRFLPTFFRSFYPTHQAATPPAIRQAIDTLALQKFPAEYDRAHGVVRLSHATPLYPLVAPVTPERLRDPHVAFFASANPGHIHGEELACLAELSVANLTPAGRRMLGLPPAGAP